MQKLYDKTYNVAIYLRLSQEDGDISVSDKSESNSISTQRDLIHAYLQKQPDMNYVTEFVDGQRLLPEERVMFVKDPEGEYVATLSLWDGMFLGKLCQRLHWLAVSDKCAGKGIAKALATAALDLYNKLGYEGFIYLLTGTWYYRAIGIYRKFGFKEYDGERSLLDGMSDEEFVKKNREAIAIVNEKLNAYRGNK